MALPITVPYTFGNATTAIPLSNLDSDYATVYQAVNGIGNGSVALANVAITGGTISGNTTASNVTVSSGTFTNVTLSNVTISSVSTPITAAEGGTGSSSAFTTNGVVYASSTSALATGSALVFDGTNLGLGVTPSAWGSGYKAIQLPTGTYGGGSFITDNGSPAITSNAYNNAGWKYVGSDYATIYQSRSGQHQWFNAPSGTAGNGISFTQAMTLDASGNLGVGTTSPSSKLTVGDNTAPAINLSDTAGSLKAQLIYRNSTTGNLELTNISSAALVFGTNNTERARIDSSGNLMVGTTSANNNNSSSFAFNVANGNQYNNHINGTASGTGYIQFSYNGTLIGSITQSGTTAVLYNITSDQRLKENIVNAPDFGSVIDSLQVRSFDWKTDQTHQRAGFVAQELVTVAPEAVHQPIDPEEMMAVDYSKLVPMLVKEIQSLRKRILTLENK